MTNKHQIMSDFQLCERIECLHRINDLLQGSYSHVFDENEALLKAVQKEVKLINKELEKRDY